MNIAEWTWPGNDLKKKVLHWASSFPYCVFLDSCNSQIDKFGQYDFLAAAGGPGTVLFKDLKSLHDSTGNPRWKFGIFSYDLKNKIEPVLDTRNFSPIPFPELFLFSPSVVIGKFKNSENYFIETEDPKAVQHEIENFLVNESEEFPEVKFGSEPGLGEYVETIQQLREHIRRGDCYEINFCRNFSASAKVKDPPSLFEKLISLSPVPFAGLARFENKWVLCASPERFLRKENDFVITQPIKGTASRGNTVEDDEKIKMALKNSDKDRAENVMIVDLSRNDLYKSSEVNSVEVQDLFEIQTFPQVHHMVSTIKAKMRKDISGLDAFLNAFPPGSMTGAPKIKACQIIDQFEPCARGIFSGTLGYFDPKGNFDFNVIIRTLLYDSDLNKLSFHTGGAITWDSVAEKEFEETEIKAKAILSLF